MPLFLVIRLFTSAYLFLSGYGHFMFYWNTSNYSLTRFFEVTTCIHLYYFILVFILFRCNYIAIEYDNKQQQVLFRLNFVPIMFMLTMNRMYQFYEFVPVVTFWFICSYILMIVYPRISAKTVKGLPVSLCFLNV